MVPLIVLSLRIPETLFSFQVENIPSDDLAEVPRKFDRGSSNDLLPVAGSEPHNRRVSLNNPVDGIEGDDPATEAITISSYSTPPEGHCAQLKDEVRSEDYLSNRNPRRV